MVIQYKGVLNISFISLIDYLLLFKQLIFFDIVILKTYRIFGGILFLFLAFGFLALICHIYKDYIKKHAISRKISFPL